MYIIVLFMLHFRIIHVGVENHHAILIPTSLSKWLSHCLWDYEYMRRCHWVLWSVVGGWRFEGVGVGQCWVVVAIAGEDLTASGCVKLLNNCMICMRSSNCLSDRTCHICGAILRRNGMISSSLSSDSMCVNSCCSNASTVIAVFSSGVARLRAHCHEPSKKKSMVFVANVSQYGMMSSIAFALF